MNVRPTLRRFPLLSLIAVAAACTGSEDSTDGALEAPVTEAQLAGALDVNDVSILLPLDEAMPIADGSAGEDAKIFAKSFDAIKAHATKQAIEMKQGGADDIQNWKVVSLRFDPCALGFSEDAMRAVGAFLTRIGVPAAAACIPQLRFIAQPVSGATTADFSAHVVFDFPPVISQTVDVEGIKDRVAELPQVKDAVRLLQAIKRASNGVTAGRPLGVHPGFKNNAAAVRPLVKQLMAMKKTPSTIAFSGLQGFGLPWAFFGGRIANGVWSPVRNIVLPETTAEKNAIVFTGSSITPDFPGSLMHVNAFVVEDPAKTHLFNMDCASCHASSGAFIFGNSLDTGFPTKRLPKNITGYIARENVQGGSWNVRNFGFFGGTGAVSGRTLAETIEVVKFINERIVKAPVGKADPTPLLGPGPDCSAQDHVVWKCIRDGRLPDGTSAATAEQCFKQCANGGRLPVREPEAVSTTPVTPLTNAGRGEPCTAAEAKLDERSVSVTGSTATLTGNDKLCLSRNLRGTFSTRDNAVVVKCASTVDACTVALSKPTVLLATDDATFFATKVFVTAGKAYRSRGQGGALLINCAADASTCTLAVSTDPKGVPQPGAVINPMK